MLGNAWAADWWLLVRGASTQRRTLWVCPPNLAPSGVAGIPVGMFGAKPPAAFSRGIVKRVNAKSRASRARCAELSRRGIVLMETTGRLSPAQLIAAAAADPTVLDDPDLSERHERLLSRASVCSYCGVGCPYTVEDDHRGRARVHPLSSLGLCVKGKTSLLTGGNHERAEKLRKRGLPDDRIRVPMLRGHDGQMHEVSWDEALDRAAWLFLHSREWVGPEAVAIYGNGQKTIESIWMASLYKLVFKLPTIGANSEHCLASAGAAHELNFGNEASFTWQQYDELAHCDVAVLHGTNAYVTFPQAFEKLKRNANAIKVVIDPVHSDTVSELQKSDSRTLHLRFRQGGDVLFNLAVARVILEHGWEDRESLARRVEPQSLIALRSLCAQARCEPEVAAQQIALPDQDPVELAATIRRYAELIARPHSGYRPRVAFVSSMGINQSTGSYGFSTNLNLLLLTGNVGRRGAGSLRIAGQSNAPSELMMGFNGRRLLFNLTPENAEHRKAVAEFLHIPESNIPRANGTAVARMAENDSLYCFLFIGTQMVRNMPRLGYWTRRLGRAFNIVIDSFVGDGVLEHADVLLPATTYTERLGVIQRGDRTLQLQQPLTEPPELAWSDGKILARLALKIAQRLRDPDTAALNELDPDVVHRTFARYLDEHGDLDQSRVFDHAVEYTRKLNLYCKLEDEHGTPISHERLRRSAGQGIQWGGDGRYADAGSEGAIFPRIKGRQTGLAKLVRPPDALLARLQAPLPTGTLSLISGRGRPGRHARAGQGRYNSGVKTLPIHGRDPDDYFVEVHPEQARALKLEAGKPARITSAHGGVVANVAFNDRVPAGSVFIDFVPGEVNRLTDYVDADEFTHQSLIKRTPVSIRALAPLEDVLWGQPDATALSNAVSTLYANWRATFQCDTDWVKQQREHPNALLWLPPQQLNNPHDEQARRVAEAAGALTAFLQRFSTDETYRSAAGSILRTMGATERSQFLHVLLPFIRRFDYQSVMHPILADFVGGVEIINDDGGVSKLDLLTAHKSAILEFKEEIVAIQLFIAIKRALELLFGMHKPIRRSDLAFVSGVGIPCAGDVPAHFLGCAPADIGDAMLIHSRAIGNSALMVVDRRRARAVRVDVVTGVLPKDKELSYLRGRVINHKRVASASEHRRFFDRLGELIVEYVRTGDDNFAFSGPVDFDWEEYRSRFAFAPPNPRHFASYLLEQGASQALGRAFVKLGVLDEARDAAVLRALGRDPGAIRYTPLAFDRERLYAGSLQARVTRVVKTILAPVLANDGGRLDVLDIDEQTGELRVRFVGSCANCPYSLLSMEQIVKPTLLAIPGIETVVHRAKPRTKELPVAFELTETKPEHKASTTRN